MGEHLTKRMRCLAFASILRQDVGFFDLPENSTGALTSKLASDAALVKVRSYTCMHSRLQIGEQLECMSDPCVSQ